MKLIINEVQYDRLFNKKKTKLVITEEQFNRLISESDMTKVINNIRTGDLIKLTDKSGNLLTFEVIDAFSGKVIMVNKDTGVYKNQIFFFSYTDLQGGDLNYKYINKKDVKDVKDLKSLAKSIPSWNSSKFKDISNFEVEGKDGDIHLNPDTGKIEHDYDDDTEKDVDKKPETPTEDLTQEILSMKEDAEYEFILSDESIITLDVVGRGPSTVAFEIKTVEGNEAERYKELIGDELEFDGSKNNLNLKDDKEYIFDIKLKRYLGGEEIEKKKPTSDYDYDPNFDSDDIEAGNKNIKTKSEDVIIHGIVDINFKKPEKAKGKEDVGDEEELSSLSDDEIKQIIDDLTLNNPNMRNAIWKRPNWLLGALGLAKDKGIVPAKKTLGSLYSDVRDKVEDFERFKPNSVGTGSFIKLEPEPGSENLLNKIDINENFKLKVRKRGDADKYPALLTRFEKFMDKSESFSKNYFIVYLKKELEELDDSYIYRVDIGYKGREGTKKVGEGKLRLKK
jgi:hypothetical protein